MDSEEAGQAIAAEAAGFNCPASVLRGEETSALANGLSDESPQGDMVGEQDVRTDETN